MTTKKLTFRQKVLVAGTLFGMFFGAGNLIFPVHLGQMAGRNAVVAMIGFIITAVGIPVFGVAAIGTTVLTIGQVDWRIIGGTAALSAVLSLLTSVAGIPEVDDGANVAKIAAKN